VISRDCRSEVLCKFVEETQRVVNWWLMEHGLGFGIQYGFLNFFFLILNY
jgi:hypothetical protein